MEKIDHEVAPEPGLNGLIETALFTDDLPRACEFYEQVLGLSQVKAGDRGCVFRVDHQRYLLVFIREAAQTPSTTSTGDTVPACAVPGREGAGPGHIAFGISAAAIDAWRTRLSKHNVKVLGEITWESGARSLYFRDPDGHLIELGTEGIWE